MHSPWELLISLSPSLQPRPRPSGVLVAASRTPQARRPSRSREHATAVKGKPFRREGSPGPRPRRELRDHLSLLEPPSPGPESRLHLGGSFPGGTNEPTPAERMSQGGTNKHFPQIATFLETDVPGGPTAAADRVGFGRGSERGFSAPGGRRRLRRDRDPARAR